MKNKKACPGTAVVILRKCQNAKDPSNRHGVIYIHSEKNIKKTEQDQLCTIDFQINIWVWEWLQPQNEKIWMESWMLFWLSHDLAGHMFYEDSSSEL